MDNETLQTGRCKPCEGIGAAMTIQEVEPYVDVLDDWQVVEGTRIEKEFATRNFVETMAFSNRIAEIAEQENHHPDLHLYYRKAKVVLSTHALGGLTENDFILTAKVNQAWKQLAAAG